MKNGWEHYATKKGFIEKGYLRKHCDGGSGRKAREASRCDCIQRCKEEEIKLLIRPELPPAIREVIEKEIEWYGRVVGLTEEIK